MYGFGSGGSKKHTIVTLDTPRLELEMMHRERNRDKGPRARSQKQELQMMMLSEFENLYERSKMSYEAEYDQGRLIRNTGCLVTACIGIGFSVTAGFLSWNGHKQVHSDTAEVLRTLSSLFSIFLALQICEYHRFKVSSIFKHYVDDAEMPWTAFSKDLPILVVELLVCLWHVPPFCSSYIPDKWMFPMFLRLYLMLRYLRDISPITRNKGRIISHGFYHLGGTSFNAWIFHARTFIYRQPGRLVMITTGILYLMMSYCIYLFERERQPDIFDFGNSLWYTAVAMTTVGYGDIVAKTDLGRLFAVMSGAMGIFLSTFCVTVASSVLTLSKHQKFANDIVSWQELEKKRIDSAATVIQAWWRLLKLEQNGLSDLMSTYRNRRMLLEASGRLRRYRKMRKNISTYGDDPVLLARLLLEGRFDPILDRVLRVERTANALEKKLRTLALLASDGQTQITSKQPGGLRSRKPSIVPMNLSTSHNVPFGSPSRDESDQLSKILSKLESFDRRLQTIEKITAEEALPSLSEETGDE